VIFLLKIAETVAEGEQLSEIETLRKNIAVIRNIIQSIIDEERRERQTDIEVNAD
jgi:ribosomal protein L29